jgi:hypothetical protein
MALLNGNVSGLVFLCRNLIETTKIIRKLWQNTIHGLSCLSTNNQLTILLKWFSPW